ncbi:hypothetical protein [Nocardia sp. CS682]|uniref:hypothetical protein n=1 Tax=Nocardia sp. CS682 TaxID=1047172 RepID=UPI0010755CC0|nr:hypothetical protein [Nocardia sp. CS682]QBS44924.1 hypothetical protein DMB37_37425 [Nocardia sp. CS682]
MLLTDWFFAVKIHQHPQDASALLESLAVIRDRHAPAMLRGFALEHLADCTELPRAYAIPDLIELLFDKDVDLDRDIEARIRDIVAKTTGETALVRALPELASADSSDIATRLRRIRTSKAHGTIETSYLELDDVTTELVVLAVLRAAARRHSDPVDELIRGDDVMEIFKAARAGSLGRLPFLLAIEILALCEEDPGTWLLDIRREGGARTDWLGQPDLVELVVRLNPPPAGVAGRLREAVRFDMLTALVGVESDSAAQPDVGWLLRCPRGDGFAVALVFWQAAQWGCAVRDDPVATVRHLERVWGPPSPLPAGSRIPHPQDRGPIAAVLPRLASLRLRPDKRRPEFLVVTGDPENDDSVLRSLHSPWLDRRLERQHVGDPIDTYPKRGPNYHHADDHVAVLRLLAAVEPMTIALRREANTAAMPDFLLAQLVNVGGALANGRLRKQIKAINDGEPDLTRVSPFDHGVLTLCVQVGKMVDRVGKGTINEQVPTALVNFLDHNAGPKGQAHRIESGRPWNLQEQMLYAQGALLISAYWAKEAFSGYITELGARSAEREGSVPDSAAAWFGGDSQSPAASLVRQCLGEFWDYIETTELPSDNPSMHEVTVLAAEAFPTLLRKSGRTVGWLAAYDAVDSERNREHAKINRLAPLLAEPMTVGGWTSLGDLRFERFQVGAELPVLTMRLLALLAEHQVTDTHEWVESWRRAISEVNSPNTLARAIRAKLATMLAASPSAGQEDTLLRLQEIVVDTVVEFSYNTIHYQDSLLYKLDKEYQLGPASREALEVRWFEAAVRQQQYRDRGADAGPWTRYGWHQTRSIRTGLVETLARAMLNRTVQAEPLVRQLSGVWQDTLHTALPMLSIAADGGRHDDPRNALSYQRRGEAVYLGWRGNLPPGTAVDRFLGETLTAGKPFVGVVAAIDVDSKQMLINCGGGDVEQSVALADVAIGDLVTLGPGNGVATPRPVVGPVGARGRASVAVDRRWQWLHLVVNGLEVRAGLDDPHVAAQWDPDVMALAEDEERVPAPMTEVYLDVEREIWLPERRIFARLIVEQFGAEPSRVVTVTLVESIDHDGQPLLLVSARPGAVYEIPYYAWESESWMHVGQMLHELSTRNASVSGVRLSLRLTDSADEARIALAVDDSGGLDKAIDQRNIMWRDLFRSGEPVDVFFEGDAWHTTVAIPNMPERVQVDLGTAVIRDRVTGRARLVAGGWDAKAQRAACVTMQLVKSEELNLDFDDLAALDTMIMMSAGQIVLLLNLIGDVDAGRLRARTVTRQEVDVAPESLTFGTDSAPRTKCAQRRAVITEVSFVSGQQQSAIPMEFDVPDETVTTLSGIVCVYGPDEDRCGIWLRMDGRAHRLDVPISSFDEIPTHLGDLVTLHRVGTGWVATAAHRHIHVRALWSAVRADAVPQGIVLGNVSIPGMGTVAAVEDTAQAVIHCLARHDANPPRMYGARVRDGAVSEVAQHAPGSPGRAIVCLHTDGFDLYGEAKPRLFRGRNLSWSSSYLIAEKWVLSDRSELIDLRRLFQPGKAVKRGGATLARPRKGAQSTDKASWWDRYVAWEREGTHIVTGAFDTDRGRPNFLELTDPILTDPSATGAANAEAITSVAFERQAHRPLVDEPYNRNDVRAKVVWSQTQRAWTASCKTVPSLSLREFEAHLRQSGMVTRQRPIEFPMRFAGRTRNDSYRFEWGFGWTVIVPAERLIIGNATRWQPFFGDLVSKFTLDVRRVGERPALCVVVQDIRWGAEQNVWADAKLRILHQVRVLVDPRSGRVVVTGVKARKYDIGGDTQQRHLRLRNAQFSPAERERIIALLTPRERAQGEQVQFDVYARVDDTKHPNEKYSLYFKALTRDAMAEDVRPRRGDLVFLIAGAIEEKDPDGSGNDHLVVFSAPTAVRGSDPAQQLRVRVHRRQFSFQESCLRVAYRDDPQTYAGVPMLVRLREETDEPGLWSGDLTSVPERSAKQVEQWLRTVGEAEVVAGDVEEQQSKAGNSKVKQLKFEITPGVLFSVNVSNRKYVPRAGSICSIEPERKNQMPSQIVESDHEFIPGGGRPALVFLKDDTLWQARHSEAKRSGMTIAGLPSITVSDPATARQFAGFEHPRFALLDRDERRKLTLSVVKVYAGALCTNEWGAPSVKSARGAMRYPQGKRAKWPELSFLDGEAKEIAQHAEGGRWRYHDRTTGHWPRGARKPELSALPDPVLSADGPLFFTDEWKLRYSATDLVRFGYPATEIVESGLPRGGGRYPVAGTTNTAVWIELSPGRVVKVPGNLLYADASRQTTMRSFLWRAVSPGDTVELHRRSTHDVRVSSLNLTNWRPGPRGYFRDAHVLLPLRERRNGGVVLGDGRWRFTYPLVGRTKELPVDQFCWLTPGNDLEPDRIRTVTSGDVVFVTFDEQSETFEIAGIDCAEVVFISDWRGYAWLRELLLDPATRASTIRALGGSYPARVAEVTPSANGLRITLAPTGWNGETPVGTMISARALGMVDASRVLVRGGALLLLTDIDELVRSIPHTARDAVVTALDHEARPLWLTWDGQRWRSAQLANTTQFEADVVADAGAERGIVVRDRASSALLWLDLDNVGLVPTASSSAVASSLQKLGRPLSLFARPEGGFSAINAVTVAQLSRIPTGQAISVQPLAPIESDTAVDAYVASVHPNTLLIELRSETKIEHVDPIRAELVSARPNSIVAVPVGTARTDIDLPISIIRALRKSHTQGHFDPTAFHRLAADHLAPCLEAARYGISEANDDSTEALVTAAWTTTRKGELRDEQRGTALRALARWLDQDGRALVTDPRDEQSNADIDVVPALSAVLLADELTDQRIVESEALEQLTVHLARLLGLLAAGSMHAEVLLRSWLLASDIAVRQGQWLRLNSLALFGQRMVGRSARAAEQFDGTLHPAQHDQVLNLCRGILSRRRRLDDQVLLNTVLALQYSIMATDSLDLVWPAFERTNCARLAALARGLTPGTTITVSQPRLHSAQSAELELILADILSARIPTPLTLRNRPSLPPSTHEWATATLDSVHHELMAAADGCADSA